MNKLIRNASSSIVKFENTHDSNTVALIYVCISTITFTVTILFGKISLSSADVVQVQIWRGTVLAIIYGSISMANGHSLAVEDKSMKWLAYLRASLASIMTIAMYFLMLKLPASLLGVIQMTSSLMISYFDYLMYGTKYTKREIFYSLLTILGVIFIINPGFILFWINEEDLSTTVANGNYSEGYEKVFWVLFYLATIGLWSFSMVLVRKLKVIPVTTLNFTFGCILTFMSAVMQLFHENAAPMETSTMISVIIFAGVFTMIDQISFIRSFQIGKQGTLNVLKNTNIIFVVLFEVIYLKEYPSVYSVIGSVIIIISSIKLTLSKASK